MDPYNVACVVPNAPRRRLETPDTNFVIAQAGCLVISFPYPACLPLRCVWSGPSLY